MPLKTIVQALAVVWLALFVTSFITLPASEADAAATARLARVAEFLTWQALALIAASLGAFATRLALARRVEGVKLIGYLPLALSAFLVSAFIVLIVFRVYVAPLFE